MILADKIINLRKKNGYSQEELASKLDVSRQSVSKWEGGQSIPDLDRIIMLSNLFGVSTDCLLKDEIELDDQKEQIDVNVPSRKKVTMEMANDYINKRYSNAKFIALGVLLCILSPITLILLGGLSEYHETISENMGCGIGIVVMLLMVSVAVGLFIFCSSKTKEYEFITEKVFDTEYGVTGLVNQKKKDYAPSYFKGNLIGVILCILSTIPLIVTAFMENDELVLISVAVLLGIVSIATFILVYVGCKNGALISLLQEGDYAKANKKRTPVLDSISGCYWILTTAVFLAWSLITQSWNITWVVWPIAALLYAAIFGVIHAVVTRNDNEEN